MDSFAGKTVLITGRPRASGARWRWRSPRRARISRSRAQRRAPGGNRARLRGARRAGAALPGDVSRQATAHARDAHRAALRTPRRAGQQCRHHHVVTFDAVTDFSVFERLLAVNYLAAVYLTAAALAHLKESRGLIVAVAARRPHGVPEAPATRPASTPCRIFESLRIELRGSGVDVTIIARISW